MAVLLTGGAGYIGSHTAVELLSKGYHVIIADNFSNSNPTVPQRIQQITGHVPSVYNVDVADPEQLRQVFEQNQITSVIHFAGYKAVGESVANPIKYYRNNLDATLSLIECMEQYGAKRLVFSSSATVYGIPSELPLTEEMPVSATNPYGQTKLMIEQILKDVCRADLDWSICLLRYFNPVGAHESGMIGEEPNGTPNNLMPYVAQVAAGIRKELHIFGNDYPTKDGTGVRDYIHVVDLAKGHIAALEYLCGRTGISTFNLGTGTPHSVLEMVAAFEKASNRAVPYVIDHRRPGDVAECYADVSKAQRELKWSAQLTLTEMCEDAWRWQQFCRQPTNSQ